ncbi:MAG: lamin tail domain-containing protein [Chloroflexi bacterium]|nr:lamin tail domain-containing protein [Chloroflexota bacterium]MBP8058924.1 lamin tail domain-containing protein [Chloroflexota bacterium]
MAYFFRGTHGACCWFWSYAYSQQLPAVSEQPTTNANGNSYPILAPPANVQIVYIEYDPPGPDEDGEYVRFDNLGGSNATLTGWTLRDDANHVFTFPSFTLAVGASVRVWTGSGSNNNANLYWGSGAAIWNNAGDTATLRNSGGQVIDVCTYSGGGGSSGASCN